MRVLGLVIAVLGWLIAVSSVELSSVGIQALVAVIRTAGCAGWSARGSQRRPSQKRDMEKLGRDSRARLTKDIGEILE